ncbi:unnamed protein product, partial [Iphiclides podalirius]
MIRARASPGGAVRAPGLGPVPPGTVWAVSGTVRTAPGKRRAHGIRGATAPAPNRTFDAVRCFDVAITTDGIHSAHSANFESKSRAAGVHDAAAASSRPSNVTCDGRGDKRKTNVLEVMTCG